MDQYGQQELQKKVGSVCAAVMINEKSKFKVNYDGTEREVSLVGTEPTHFTLGDLGEALTAVFTQEYGDPGEPIYTVEPGSEAGGKTVKPKAGHDDHGDEEGASCNGPQHESPSTEGVDDTPIELPGFKEIKKKP